MEEAPIDVVIPVHNEERTLEASIRRLDANIPRTILQDLRGILRLRLEFWGIARRD
jgi:glycosyltransferase involved in cell wall biosynthesis